MVQVAQGLVKIEVLGAHGLVVAGTVSDKVEPARRRPRHQPIMGGLQRAGLDRSVQDFRIEQVVSNLLTNALRYGGKSLIEVRVYARDGQAFIEVQDRGIGISEENQQRIFQQFERVSAKTVVAGLGLGLFIVKEVVTAHGGTIEVSADKSQVISKQDNQITIAIDTNQDSGVWGGTSEDERRAIRRQIAARHRSSIAG